MAERPQREDYNALQNDSSRCTYILFKGKIQERQCDQMVDENSLCFRHQGMKQQSVKESVSRREDTPW